MLESTALRKSQRAKGRLLPHRSPGGCWKQFPSARQLVISAKRLSDLDVFPQLAPAFPKSHSWCGRSPWDVQPWARLRFLAAPHKRPIFIIIAEIKLAAGGQVIWGLCHSKYHLFDPPLLCSSLPCSLTSNVAQGFPCRCPFHPRNPIDQPLLFILLKN